MGKTLKGVALTAVSVLCIGVGSASAANTTEVVTEGDVVRQPENTPPTNDWVIYNRNAGTAVFRNGPTGAPLGFGSLELATPTGADKIQAFNYDHTGTLLADVDAMGYSNYRSAGSAQQTTAINVEVDVNGADPAGFTTLVFEPVYNTDQGTVQTGVWQDWDAYNGGNARWWSTKNIPGACAFDCFVTWDAIVAANPNAVIVGAYGLNQGSGNGGLTASNDALVFGANGDSVTYDFENQPVSKDQCKKGGWENYGGAFKNQGDCVSSVASKNK